MRRALLTLAIVGLAFVACGGGEEDPPRDPIDAQLWQLFDVVNAGDLQPDSLEPLFVLPSDEQELAELFDSADLLAGEGELSVVQRDALETIDRIAVDLRRTSDGREEQFSFQLEGAPEAAKIVWFSGPGVEWPRRTRRGDGLSTSAPPESGDGR